MICEHIHGKIVQKNSKFKSFCILVRKFFFLTTLCYADEKSSLLKLMVRHLKDTGVQPEQIIEMNFESFDFRGMNADAIYHYVKERIRMAVGFINVMTQTGEKI